MINKTEHLQVYSDFTEKDIKESCLELEKNEFIKNILLHGVKNYWCSFYEYPKENNKSRGMKEFDLENIIKKEDVVKNNNAIFIGEQHENNKLFDVIKGLENSIFNTHHFINEETKPALDHNVYLEFLIKDDNFIFQGEVKNTQQLIDDFLESKNEEHSKKLKDFIGKIFKQIKRQKNNNNALPYIDLLEHAKKYEYKIKCLENINTFRSNNTSMRLLVTNIEASKIIGNDFCIVLIGNGHLLGEKALGKTENRIIVNNDKQYELFKNISNFNLYSSNYKLIKLISSKLEKIRNKLKDEKITKPEYYFEMPKTEGKNKIEIQENMSNIKNTRKITKITDL